MFNLDGFHLQRYIACTLLLAEKLLDDDPARKVKQIKAARQETGKTCG